ncbi:MAG: DUF1800 domain-containing protein [Rhodospirillaceae bacterium]|nr:DUF1800 domain-containing protein [Rhodospirillaceae bacterium]
MPFHPLSWACLVLLAGVLAPVAAPAMPAADAKHFLLRTGFGAGPDDIAALEKLTHEQAVRRVLDTARQEPFTKLPDLLATRPDWPGQYRNKDDLEKQEFNRTRDREAAALKAWWYGEMIATPSPFTERMVMFWHNHFTSSFDKVRQPDLIYTQQAIFRRNAFGSFRTMLMAVAKDPAMIKYLDNVSNKKGGANENFARELFELFTLGEGNYTEKDIKEAARAFTGWQVNETAGAYFFNARDHDDGAKTVFGRTGKFGGEDIVNIVLDQPKVALYVTAKLWRSLISDTPDPKEVERLASIFRASDYNIRALVEAMLLSPAFLAPANRAVLVKSPVDLLVGTIRMLNMPVSDTAPLVDYGRRLQQDILNPPNVKGWPGGINWVSTYTLIQRRDILGRFLRGEEVNVAAPTGLEAMMAMQAAVDPVMTNRPPAPLRQFGVAGWMKMNPQLAGNPQAISNILLATAPVATVFDGRDPSVMIERILLDPAYQMK